ncbi:MAG: S8 family peptidase [Bacteroidota bacterium]
MKWIQLCILLLITHFNYAQVVKFGFDRLVEQKPDKNMPFAVVYEGPQTLEVLKKHNIAPKKLTKEWVYITTTPAKIKELNESGSIRDFYFENSRPQSLNDSTRVKAHIDEIHMGTGGLSMPYTGKNVIVGIVDDGIDFRHPDFRDANGNTRVLYLWDHMLDSAGHPNIPQPYNYGLLYDSSDINLHITAAQFGALGGQAFHGTNVSGIATGNGLANGKNKGMAPDCKIIFVRTNFQLEEWSLSIADACQFIFDKADEMGLPCVINLSLGDYFGSHDGRDPATESIEEMLDEQPGRIVVCAAGNSGNVGKYHVGGDVDSDTSFVWFKNNPSGAFGANTIFFELWADQTDMQNVHFGFGANLPSGNFASRAQTAFYNTSTALGGVIEDTLRNGNGDEIAILEIYPSVEYGNYHLQVLFTQVDSTAYNYRFATAATGAGTGHYDLWSGTGFGLNAIVQTLPTAAEFPQIIHYHPVDSLQSIVTGWACSEKVITVANFVNRQSYTDLDGVVHVTPVTAGTLSVNSSKGPSRVGVVKPDISAPGDFSITASPLSYLSNPVNNFKIDEGGWHNANGGTSMASPVIAGIAALYLEKCNQASYTDFKNDLLNNAFADNFTGTVPNNAFGYGKPHGLGTLLETSYSMEIDGFHLLCGPQADLGITASEALDSTVWDFNGTRTNADELTITSTGFYTAYTYNDKACKERDTLTIGQGNPPAATVISFSGGVLSSTAAANYQWYFNGAPLSGQTFQSLIGAVSPTGQYQVATTSPDGCMAFSNIYQQNASVPEYGEAVINIYPNPVEYKLCLDGLPAYTHFSIRDIQGKTQFETDKYISELDVEKLAKGIYFIRLVSENKIFTTKFEKM